MKNAQRLKEAIQGMVQSPATVWQCKVLRVNGDNTIDVDYDGIELSDVLLQSITGSASGQLKTPAVNSIVLISKVDPARNEFYVLADSELDAWQCKVDNSEVKLSTAPILIKRGSETMGSILNELINQIKLIYAPKDVAGLEALLLKINDVFQ